MEENYFFTTERACLDDLDFFTVKSPALGARADVCAYLPPNSPANIPLVILLHGVYGSHWAWALHAKVHKTLQGLIDSGQCQPMLLLMPSDGLFADGSAYAAHQNANYEKWITEDCLQLARENYTEVSASSPIFITGLSMGAYGALRLGAKYPTVFKAFSGLSSITAFEQLQDFVQDFEIIKNAVLDAEDVLDVLKAHKNALNPFRFDCGDSDSLFEANVALHKALLNEQIEHIFEAKTGGHNWEYWSSHIAETFLFFNQYA